MTLSRRFSITLPISSSDSRTASERTVTFLSEISDASLNRSIGSDGLQSPLEATINDSNALDEHESESEDSQGAPPVLIPSQPWVEQSGFSKTINEEREERTHSEKTDGHAATASTVLRSWYSRYCHLTADTWLPESSALVMSVVSLCTLVGLLAYYDRRALPSITYGITLNAIIAILAACSESTLLYTASGTISQLKWFLLQRQDHRLDHIQIFDDASRGPIGAMTLAFNHRGRSLASLGAVIVALTVTYGPFIQQIVRYPTRHLVDHTKSATAMKTSNFRPDLLDISFVRAVVAPIWSNASDFVDDPVCPTGNCRWPPFMSVGWCSQCAANAESLVTFVGDCTPAASMNASLPSCSISLGAGYSVSFEEFNPASDFAVAEVIWPVQMANGSQDSTWPAPAAFLTMGRVMLNFTYEGHAEPMYFATPNKKVAFAERCSLSPCLQQYQLSTTSGITTTNRTFVTHGKLFWKEIPNPPGAAYTLCWQSSDEDVINKHSFENNQWHNVESFAFCGLEVYPWIAGQLLSSKILVGPMDIDFSNTYSNAALITKQGLGVVMSKIADSFTLLAHRTSGEPVHGESIITQTYIEVRWRWLIFPIVLACVATIVLLQTVRINRKENTQLWRASSLALLFHGLDSSILREVKMGETVHGMEEAAEKIHVRLDVSTETGNTMLISSS